MLEVLSLVKSISDQLNDQDLKKTVDRLSILASEEQKNHLHIDLTHLSIDPSFLMIFKKTIKESTRVCFQYISTQNEQTTREVDSLSLQYKFRMWYLYAYCHLRNDYREFKVSHILNLERLTTSIKDIPPFTQQAAIS